MNINELVRDAVTESGITSGIATIYVSHTTAGITINENTDPDVTRDLQYLLEKTFPWDDPEYQHFEGNTAAHMKASIMGSSSQVIIDKGRLVLGTWQGIYFCEFDGPRERTIHIKIISG
jgi:secondary thiamine-phosphate synthase enzyme